MNAIEALKIMDLVLSAVGIAPSLLLSLSTFYSMLKDKSSRGEDVTVEEIDALLTRIRERHARIQAA